MASTWDKTLNFRKGEPKSIYKGQSMGVMSVFKK
jgi:hypothetical protein